MIRVEDMVFRYRSGEFELRVPELIVDRGSSVAVVGPSGSGKTTLLNLVAGVLPPTEGRIFVEGTEVSRLSRGARRVFRLHRMGLVFQEFELLDYLSVLDNILLPYRIANLWIDREVRGRAAALAERVGIGDKLRRSIRRLSQGERQRVAFCRALLMDPALLLADEPTGNLDPANKDRVLDMLFQAAGEVGATILAVTHDHSVLDRFDRVLDVAEWGHA